MNDFLRKGLFKVRWRQQGEASSMLDLGVIPDSRFPPWIELRLGEDVQCLVSMLRFYIGLGLFDPHAGGYFVDIDCERDLRVCRLIALMKLPSLAERTLISTLEDSCWMRSSAMVHRVSSEVLKF
jgi:hypothetical protein